MVDAEILAYYEHGLDRDRLAAGRQRIEFPRIWDLLERFLPAPPAKVLDVGGGAGAYAIPLAQAGYEVYLIDPVLREGRRALPPPPAAASNSSRACPSSWTSPPPAITSCRCSGSWRPSRRSSA
jgi:hypothetical protein